MASIRRINRRAFFAASAGGLFGTICRAEDKPKDGTKPIAKAAPLVKFKEKWGADHLYEFLNALPPEEMLSLKKSLGLVDEKAGVNQLKGKSQDVRDIQRHALWVSSNSLAYYFRDPSALDYHNDVVAWVAGKAGVDQKLVDSAPTFTLEREILKKLFSQFWDKLDEKQRLELLDKIDPNGTIKDKTAVVALSGAAALGTLSATVMFSGFAFYTTMSVTISTVAGFFGLTLPFAAYTGASSLVAFLSGPVGWAIMGLAALGGLALAGRANPIKTTAFVCQIHMLKVAALLAANIPEREVFPM